MMSEHDIKQVQDSMAAFTSSFLPPDVPVYSDEYIEYWAAEYHARRIWRYGVLFGVFLRQPQQILDALERRGFMPLLPEQRRVQQRLDEKDVIVVASGDPRTVALLSTLWFGCERPGPNQVQSPALHGDRYVQPMSPRQHLAKWKTGGNGA